MEENKRVLLGMSGGTDSSVAAMRLLEAGYEVIGVTFRFYELNGSTEYLEDARNLAERLGIRHITYDAREIFSKQIIEYFVQEYLAGRTPVPCILCNNYLKWPLLAKIADEMGVFYIATGHYAQNIQLNNTFYITYAADSDKDQTFFLWGLKQDILCRMLLPMVDNSCIRFHSPFSIPRKVPSTSMSRRFNSPISVTIPAVIPAIHQMLLLPS